MAGSMKSTKSLKPFESLSDTNFPKSSMDELLLSSVKNDKISHSYLFLGVQGIGKKMIAKEFAKMLLCLDENKYCNNCKSCIEFDSDNHPDKLIVTPEVV